VTITTYNVTQIRVQAKTYQQDIKSNPNHILT